jgi:ribulose-5-phosphate 4-epimerase/fuculose-1-phosphate aldolase
MGKHLSTGRDAPRKAPLRDRIAKYAGKLLADRSAVPAHAAFAARDGKPVSYGNPALACLCEEVLSSLGCQAVLAARPSLPFADFLVRRAPAGKSRLAPQDAETRTFLRDIPFLRREEPGKDAPERIARLLGRRNGMIAEGLGIVARGAATVEQAYIHYSCVFHTVFVKYLLDVLAEGFLLPGEKEAFESFRRDWLRPLTAEGLAFREGPLEEPADILAEAAAVGRYTVERGLVDSFFGNLSCRAGDTIYISRTGASLDELPGRIVRVPMDGASADVAAASSELPAHRAIYETCGARTVLHAHPKFAVAMSMICGEQDCPVTECWRDCDRVRLLGDTPVVAGETGPGLAQRLPSVVASSGKAIVYGHGVFTVGERNFEEAFRAMVAVENWCREEYFRRLSEKIPG